MKNIINFLGIIVFVAVIGICFVSCDFVNDDTNGNGRYTLTISGVPKVGETITTTYNGDGWVNSTFYLHASASNAPISEWEWATRFDGQGGDTFFIDSFYENKYIRAERLNNKVDKNSDGWAEYVYSNIIGPIQPED